MNGAAGENEHRDELTVAHDAEMNSEPTKPSQTRAEEDITTRALRFLSTATPETIGGIAVGLAACTYMVLGRVGLVLIGALGGVVLHATWEGQTTVSIEEARKEKGLDIVKRLLDLRDAQAKDENEEEDSAIIGNSFEGFRPDTAAALTDLTDAVIRDYVRWWYGPILPKDNTFPAAARQTFVKLLLSISSHMSRKRPADTFLDFLTNSSSIVIVFLTELSSVYNASQGSSVPAAEAVYTYLSANPDSNLANVLSQRQQTKKFKMIAEDILQNFLEKSAYDCDPARIFLREALAGLVLETALQTCSKPEWMNGWIVYLLEEGEPDFSQAIDAGVTSDDDPLLSNPFNDFDGNVGNIRIARTPKAQVEKQKQESKKHMKRLSKAEEAMEEAMEEAKRLSQLIAEADASKIDTPQSPLDDAPPALVEALQENAESLHLDTSTLTSARTDSSSATARPSTTNLSPLKDITQTNGQDLNGNGSTQATTIVSPQRPISKASESSFSGNSATSPNSAHGPKAFTSFDQLVPQSTPMALQEDSPARRKPNPLTLHNANITILDDSTGADKGRLRSKPNAELLIQVEPGSSEHPGWMTIRKYPDFEPLHEILRRIAQVSGVTAFTEQHQTLPNWKEHTKSSLRGELERYLRDACWYRELAESDAMKRFLEKDSGSSMGSKNGFPGIGWPTPSAFESMGKGMLDVLASAPKGVAQGGKALGGGITGVFNNIGNLGQKSNGSSNNVMGMHTSNRASTSTLPRMDSMNSITTPRPSRVSEDSLRASPIVSTQPSSLPPMERRPSYQSIAEAEEDAERASRPRTSARSSMSGRRSTTQSRDQSRAPSRKGTPLSSPIHMGDMRLPPPPSEIAEDYGSQTDATAAALSRTESTIPPSRTSTSTAPSQPSPARPSMSSIRRSSIPIMTPIPQTPALPRRPRKEDAPLSEAETRVAVELLFAVINETYTLSSAWNIRRTLLVAAKTYLLRPGNPSLSSIQTLIQDSVIAANTTDAGVAAHLRKLRENTLPTEEELKVWPAEMSSEDKERLRIKARKLLVERGVPTALTGVMGQAATGEAMGRIFDCLQVEEVARGLMFGLLLQGLRAVTQ